MRSTRVSSGHRRTLPALITAGALLLGAFTDVTAPPATAVPSSSTTTSTFAMTPFPAPEAPSTDTRPVSLGAQWGDNRGENSWGDDTWDDDPWSGDSGSEDGDGSDGWGDGHWGDGQWGDGSDDQWPEPQPSENPWPENPWPEEDEPEEPDPEEPAPQDPEEPQNPWPQWPDPDEPVTSPDDDLDPDPVPTRESGPEDLVDSPITSRPGEDSMPRPDRSGPSIPDDGPVYWGDPSDERTAFSVPDESTSGKDSDGAGEEGSGAGDGEGEGASGAGGGGTGEDPSATEDGAGEEGSLEDPSAPAGTADDPKTVTYAASVATGIEFSYDCPAGTRDLRVTFMDKDDPDVEWFSTTVPVDEDGLGVLDWRPTPGADRWSATVGDRTWTPGQKTAAYVCGSSGSQTRESWLVMGLGSVPQDDPDHAVASADQAPSGAVLTTDSPTIAQVTDPARGLLFDTEACGPDERAAVRVGKYRDETGPSVLENGAATIVYQQALEPTDDDRYVHRIVLPADDTTIRAGRYYLGLECFGSQPSAVDFSLTGEPVAVPPASGPAAESDMGDEASPVEAGMGEEDVRMTGVRAGGMVLLAVFLLAIAGMIVRRPRDRR
ncbi:hypothetical protein [Brevibacterium litoralis]|uniref:hypothetical protein n=1 Tax=Brevibacterium litoralis TaxID=3138935 RepID=UPI0032EB7503